MQIPTPEIEKLIGRLNKELKSRPNMTQIKEGHIPVYTDGTDEVQPFEHTLAIRLDKPKSINELESLMRKAMKIRASRKPADGLVKFECMRNGWWLQPSYAEVPGVVSCVLGAIWLPPNYSMRK